MSVYLDYNATAAVRPEAAAAVTQVLEARGQPVVRPRRRPRGAGAWWRPARAEVAALIAAPASTVVFTSGGTEANALALESAVAAGTRRLIV